KIPDLLGLPQRLEGKISGDASLGSAVDTSSTHKYAGDGSTKRNEKLERITIPEIPRVVRLVRSIVLSAREEPYVEAAISMGTSLPRILWRHLMPNTFAPLTVQATYVCASAILTEAILSFLGAGVSTETPTWGNIMAETRIYFRLKPELIFWPGFALSMCILAINLLGDWARDALDPGSSSSRKPCANPARTFSIPSCLHRANGFARS
ncbi:ABC transporter permease, partial [Falsirhodobacter sp. alg1]|uniref:ABC transporter permease n=1 Tax=Falsirhodobacter sp. alg1 TaxID=1472418 RepID=UPI00128EDF56